MDFYCPVCGKVYNPQCLLQETCGDKSCEAEQLKRKAERRKRYESD